VVGPPNLWITLFMVMPMIADAATQWIGFRTSTNELRLITGLLFGIALSPLLVYLLSVVPSSKRVPILRKYLPTTAELDNKNPWLNNWALSLGSLIAVTSFFAIISVAGSVNPLYYWALSSLIIVSVIWHIILLPIFLVILLFFSVKTKSSHLGLVRTQYSLVNAYMRDLAHWFYKFLIAHWVTPL